MFKTQPLDQNDARWRSLQLGNSPETIGGWGGLLTSITMMLNGIGYAEETPVTVNAKLKKAGGFLKALPILPYVAYIWPNCIYRDITRCEASNAPVARITAAAAKGKPVILQVDSSQKAGMQTHFVLVKEKRGDDYVVYDPLNPDQDVLLTERYKYRGGTLRSEITAVLWFDFDKAELPPRPEATRLPLPAGKKYTLHAAEERVVLRAASSVDSYPWKCLFLGTELTCLEPEAAAQAKLGVKNQWIPVQDPEGIQGYVSALFVAPDLSALLPPTNTVPSRKKWCLKNVSLQRPVVEMREYTLKGDGPILAGKPVKPFNTLRQNAVVSVLDSDDTLPGLAKVMYQETYRDSGQKKWVTVRVMGRVHEADLDDYYEEDRDEFREPVVVIDNQTEDSTDGQQDFYLEGDKSKPRYNMCGELCIASLVGKGIDVVLKEWKGEGDPMQFTREQKQSRAMYESMVGNVDKPLERSHIEHLLRQQIGERGEETWQRYQEVKTGEGEPIHFAATDRVKQFQDAKDTVPVVDKRRASKELQHRLQTHYLITNVRINTKTGGLNSISTGERNHWIVLDKITRNGSRVELYNPFPNRRQEYTFGELYDSIGGDPRAGWWIRRDHPKVVRKKPSRSLRSAEEIVLLPRFQVAIDNRTDKLDDAEQYMRIRGEGSAHKTNLCGEFSIAFILGQSLETSLKRWLETQGTQAGLRELVTLLQAYGFTRKKYLKPQKDVVSDPEKYYVTPNIQPEIAADGKQSFKSFSIDTVLEYWKGVQPDLYNSLLGNGRNEPTGPEDLITILKAYGYTREDFSYYRPGSQEVFGYAPGRDAEVIGKTHSLLAGVNISGRTGRLQPSGVAHWVVVTRITPRGNLVGGNGGWVEIYNSFPNCWEEYSYREFMDAFRGMSEGTTLWIKKDVTPVFAPQRLAAAKSKEKDLKSSAKGGKKEKLDGKSPKKRREEKDKARGKKGTRVPDVNEAPPLDANRLVSERLNVEAIPWEVGEWLRATSNEDQFFAEALTDALLECGILSIQEQEVKNKKVRTAVLADPSFSNTPEVVIQKSVEGLVSAPGDPISRVAQAVIPLFMPRVIEQIKDIQKKMPWYAYQPWPTFRAWTRGLASTAASKELDPPEVESEIKAEIKKRLERLSNAVRDRPESFPVRSVTLTRFTSSAVEEEIRKIYSSLAPAKIKQIKRLWELEDQEDILPAFREWAYGLAAGSRKNVYRVKRWGDPGMSELAFDISALHAKGQDSNFQAIGLYNTATKGFGAVSNYLEIPPEDVLRLEAIQIEDQYESKREDWLRQKMNWLCQYRGRIYMFDDEEDHRGKWIWRRPDGIRWGTLALGGNVVQVTGIQEFEVKLPGEQAVRPVKMARLKGFKRTDWDRPLDELLAEGLVHRCFCVHKGNEFGDSPQGIVYSPFWSPEDWEFKPATKGVPAPTALWIPFDYLENLPEDAAIGP